MFNLKIMKFTIILIVYFTLTACGSEKGSVSPNNNSSGNDVFTIENGLITLEEYDGYMNGRYGIVRFKVEGNKTQKVDFLTNSKDANVISDGTMVFARFCKNDEKSYNEILMGGKNNSFTPITPCSKNISGYQSRLTYFEKPQLSPDNKYLAVGVKENSHDNYTTTVYDMSRNELARFDDYKGAIWLSKNSLALQSTKDDGLFIINTDNFSSDPILKQASLPMSATDLHISNSKKQLMYIYLSRVWIMNIETGVKRVLPIEHSDIVFATWSPSEKQISYIRMDTYQDPYQSIYFYNIDTKKTVELDSHKILNPDAFGSFLHKLPTGPISWSK